MEIMGNGWIKLHRELLDHWVYDDPEKLKIWLTLLSKASHQIHKINIGYELVELNPGELIFGTIKFADAINVSRDKLYRTVKMFEKDGMIKYDTSTYQGKFSVIKILNWSKYQKPSSPTCQEDGEFSQKGDKRVTEGEQTPDKRSTNAEQTPNKTNNKDNNVKNVNKDKNKPSVPYQKIKKLYNQICGDQLPSIRTISDQRKKHLRARWKEEGNLDIFEYLFRKTIQSDFLTGDNDRGWQVDFDWLIKNETNFNKVLEGRYDNSGKKSGQSEKDERLARIYQEYQDEEEGVEVL